MRLRRRFSTRDQARHWLTRKFYLIPWNFIDDGMTAFPDNLFGWKLAAYGRVHDWLYCSRSHPRGTMSKKHRRLADKVLRSALAAEAPRGLRWIPRLVFRAVRMFGAPSYDSCGPDRGELCRHGMRIPVWMEADSEV